MTAIAPTLDLPRRRSARARLAPLATLAARRFQLVARTPRELLVPLLTPIMFALVIAPALMQASIRAPPTSRSSRSEPSDCSFP